jgi:hypothetical protein
LSLHALLVSTGLAAGPSVPVDAMAGIANHYAPGTPVTPDARASRLRPATFATRLAPPVDLLEGVGCTVASVDHLAGAYRSDVVDGVVGEDAAATPLVGTLTRSGRRFVGSVGARVLGGVVGAYDRRHRIVVDAGNGRVVVGQAARTRGTTGVFMAMELTCPPGTPLESTLAPWFDGTLAGLDTLSPVDADGDGFPADVDCDDDDANVNPAAAEVCNEVDDNCRDGVDDADPAWIRATGVETFADADLDGFGDPGTALQTCVAPAGRVTDATDCDDTRAAVNPAAAEVCNEIDDNCRDGVDDADPAWIRATGVETFADADLDGFGDPGTALQTCVAPAGRVTDATDCDDTRAAVNPAAAEVCNGLDDNCRDGVDDADPAWDSSEGTFTYADGDLDGHGDPDAGGLTCGVPAGRSLDADDCDDTTAAVHPDATEICDSLDNDCDGHTDPWATFADQQVLRSASRGPVDVPWGGGTTWSFWMRPTGIDSQWTNLLHVGDANTERNPAVWFYPGQTRLQVRWGSDASWNDGADPVSQLPMNDWTHVAIRASDTRLDVYYDGVRQIARGGSGWRSSVGTLFTSDPWFRSANVEVQGLEVACGAVPDEEIQRAAELEPPPPESCLDLYEVGHRTNGVYSILTVDGWDEVRCDMTRGGWTRVVRIGSGDRQHTVPEAGGDPSAEAGGGKLSDVAINAIATEDRWLFTCGTGPGRDEIYLTHDQGPWSSTPDPARLWSVDADGDGLYECQTQNTFGGGWFQGSTSCPPQAGYSYSGMFESFFNGCMPSETGIWGADGELWVR